MNRKAKIYLETLSLMVFSVVAYGQAITDFQYLSEAVNHRLRPYSELEVPTAPLVDCSYIPTEHLKADPTGFGLSQWIYNTAYAWHHIPLNGGICIFLKSPEQRGLTREEARVLLSASRLSFSREEQRAGLSEKLGYPVVFEDEMPTPQPVVQLERDTWESGPGSMPIVVIEPDGSSYILGQKDLKPIFREEWQPPCRDSGCATHYDADGTAHAVSDWEQVKPEDEQP